MGTCGKPSLPFVEFWPIFPNNTIIVDQPFRPRLMLMLSTVPSINGFTLYDL